jgi:hypothetical protein
MPAFGQMNEQVARGAAVTVVFCRTHGLMKAARTPDDLARVHDRLMMALRGAEPTFVPPWADVGQNVTPSKPGKPYWVPPWADVGQGNAGPSPELVQASLTNLNQLCDLHRWLHEVYAAGATAERIALLQRQIDAAPESCSHGA